MAPIFKVAEFVQILVNGSWQEGVVQAVRFGKSGSVSYLVCIFDQSRTLAVPQKDVRPSEQFAAMLSQELEEEMPDPTQDSDNPSIFVSQAPWNDRDDFVNPKPMVPPKKDPKKETTPPRPPTRFKIMTDEEIDALQRGSKSTSTHKHTQWALKTLRGLFDNLFVVYGLKFTCISAPLSIGVLSYEGTLSY